MKAFEAFWSDAVALAWGLPLVILLVGAGIYFFFASIIVSRFKPLATLLHAIDIIRGKFNDRDLPGELTHFQALTAALSATVGMGNIGGVALAIAAGGPGAIFWMWVAGTVGMASKFFTCTLATLYRKIDENGVVQGGPMYVLEVGLGAKLGPKLSPVAKALAMMFALFGMIGCLSLFQANQMSSLLTQHWGVPWWTSGSIATAVVAIVILGGVTRVGAVTSRIVPFMLVLYFSSAVYILLTNAAMIPGLFASIFHSAFNAQSVAGGATGITFIIITGVRRAAFSNEAGIGTAALAHGAAKTKEPVREGLTAMMGPFLDTHIVCTLTALVILSTGVQGGDGVVMTVSAFEQVMGMTGKVVLAVVITLFAVSTMISYSYYSLKCARYLFGHKLGQYYIYMYLASIMLGSAWSASTVVNIMDTAFAMMAIPNLIGALILSPVVLALIRDYYRRMNL